MNICPWPFTVRLMLASLLALTVVSVHARSRTLNLFIWSEYIDPAIIAAFEKQHDCKVRVDLYEDTESMLAKIQGTGGGQYDVVVPSDNIIPAMVKQKLLAPLRHENIPNLRHLDPPFSNPDYDPGNRYSAAYQWGTVGLLVRRVEGRPLPDSWGALFDPEQQAGPFLLMDSMRDTIGVALKYKGWSVNATEAKQLREARDLLVQAKRRSVGFDGSVGVKNKILGKVAHLGMVYSGEGVRAAAENPGLAYLVPKEGSIVWVDSMVVLAKAPNRDLAERFINHILEPEVGAQLSAFTQFATPNQAAKAFMSASDLANTAVYPTAQTRERLEYLKDLGPRLRLYDEVWTQIKAR